MKRPNMPWVILCLVGIVLTTVGVAIGAAALDDRDSTPSTTVGSSPEQRVAIDTCHYRTAGTSTKCGPASFRETPGGTKVFTVPVNKQVTLLCRGTGPVAKNNQVPPTRRSDVWMRARDDQGREAWVSAIVVDAWPPERLDVPPC